MGLNFMKKLKKLLICVDLFYSNDLLRYKSQSEYKTLTGGIISLIAIVAVAIGFSSMIISTLNMSTISSKLEIVKTGDPSRMQIVGGEQNFMFGLFVQTMDVSTTFDLLNGPQFFDIVMREVVINPGSAPVYRNMSLESCTAEHWSMEPNVIENFENFQVSKWLCPKLHEKIILSGIYGSNYFSYMEYSLYPCKNSSENGNKCAPQAQIDQIFFNNTNFYLTLSYVNAVMNPNQVKYVSYYFETQNYIIFSKDIGTQSWIYLSDFTIESDNSILPFKDIKTEKGYIGEAIGSKLPFAVSNDGRIATMYLAKSRNSLIYTRQVLKISQVISYMGGLISALVGTLFIFKLYTDTSLQINISSELFYLPPQNPVPQENDEKQIKQNEKIQFNFTKFLRLYFYKVLQFLNRNVDNYVQQKKMSNFQQQIGYQLDIKILLNRILKLQMFVSEFFQEQSIRMIKQYKQITWEKAKQLRTLLAYDEYFGTIKHLITSNKIHENICDEQSVTPNQMISNGMMKPQIIYNPVSKSIAACQNLERLENASDYNFVEYVPALSLKKAKRNNFQKQSGLFKDANMVIVDNKASKNHDFVKISTKNIIVFDKDKDESNKSSNKISNKLYQKHIEFEDKKE